MDFLGFHICRILIYLVTCQNSLTVKTVDQRGFLTFDFYIYNFFVSKSVLCAGEFSSFICVYVWMTQVYDVIVYQHSELLQSVA